MTNDERNPKPECRKTLSRSFACFVIRTSSFLRISSFVIRILQLRIMESPLPLVPMHWDHEPREVPRRRKAPINRTHSRRFARFGDARRSRSVWSACVFSAAFPREASIRCPGQVNEEPPFAFAHH